ncbi:hypothetical protein VTN77DRAFT_9292 [Rasamsonia byssochlamydoides]|uniref:uncharacterized protein n=1 Tax=Rasamsonia byssochlamydoides TaxID=89139 RepID=UPI0037447DE8
MSADSTRSNRLTKFFSLVRQGKRTVKNAADTKLLLEAICDQQDRPACIETLVASPPALNALQYGLRLDVSPTFIDENTAPFIRYLSEPAVKQMCQGHLLHEILIRIAEPPTLWNALLASYKARSLSQPSLHAFAWLLLELLLLPKSSQVNIDEDAQTVDADGYLLESSSHEIRSLGHKIRHTLQVRSFTVPQDPENAPGGRHDNDFEDFRRIAILPTADELLAADKPFYRRADYVSEAQSDHRVAIHLDNQFRLLREDMLSELREDLKIARGQKRGRRSPLVLRNLAVVGISCGDINKWKPCALAIRCQSGLRQLTSLPVAERRDFLNENKTFLKHQAFGCLIRGGEVVAFATVDRDIDSLVLDDPVINLQISGEEALKKTLSAFKLYNDVEFLLVDTPIFAYEPILRCLQEKADLALAKELLAYNPEEKPSHSGLIPESIIRSLEESGAGNIQHILQTSTPIRLDPSQLESLLAGLRQSLSLIQGPPGTGKSFIGALLAKAFHAYTSETILVMCYTNHALDQFLEDFLKIGISEDAIVRLGAKSTAKTANLSLFNQRSTYRRSQASWDLIRTLEANAYQLQESLKNAFNSYNKFNISSKEILEFLEFEDPSFYEALTVPEEANGMTRVGRRGRQVKPSYLYDRWSQGKDAGVFADELSEQSQQVWAMDDTARQACIRTWNQTLLEESVVSLQSHVQNFDRCQDRLEKVWGEKVLSILKQKRIIGCTTTFAAKFAKELTSVSPAVILLEEAGEILESHVLTAMSSQTKQVILIGDHKQLRPKVNNYALTVEKGDGYDLNRSLFERLVLAGYPHTTLTKQHRMSPEISTLVRHLSYPDLLDDEKTLNRPKPRGLQDRVIFFHHDHLEVDFAEISDRRDEGAKSSKRNLFEAEMVLKIVRYLGQQGYGTDKLVVLTPYLGQLHLLRHLLIKDTDPVLNDLDSYDLVRAGLLSPASAQYTKRRIRLSTIDNYQGEESDIVIVSLTRSNTAADIGFMAAPQRLNVLLSRARNALIMMGNTNTFKKSRRGKETWLPFLDKLSADGHLYDGLPVKCERHPQRTALLKTKEDFDRECPDGGCSAPCGVKLGCGVHECPQRCHQLSDHSKMQCNRLVEWVCSRKHKSTRLCFQKNVSCGICEREDRAKELKRQRDHKLNTERERRRREYAQQLMDLQDEIERQRDFMREKSEEEERQRVLQQHRQDLADLRATVNNTKKLPTQDHRNGHSSHSSAPSRSWNRVPDAKKSSPSTRAEGNLNNLKSAAKEDWEHQKEFEGATNQSIDSLMDMIGLEEVKQKFLSIKARVDTAIRQNVDTKDERFGAVLLGNPGTGKTTVARLYAKFLTSVGVLPGNSFVETTASRLANDGVSGCKKLIEDLLNNGGGALFIDEAYQLASGQNYGGVQVLDFLLPEVENLTGKVVVILAGYQREMEAFFAHNPGLPSRFPHELKFNDYDDDELLQILTHKIGKKYAGRMKVEDGMTGLYCRIVARRIGRGRGRQGFGNARAVENMVARIAARQADRLHRERKAGIAVDDLLLTKEDLIGPEPSKVLENCAAWVKLQSLIGLGAVKESARALFSSIQYNYTRELEEKPLVDFSLNRVFLGSPGTGKTTVAKLYGQILADLGFLSNGEVIVKNPADFVGSALGESEKNTKGILAATVGKVLVIDEFYGLYGGGGYGGGTSGDPYKTAVIDTIVAEVQSTPGDDRCVLLLGYKDQMEDMFQNVNPGLTRRFPLDSAFLFEDFTDDELCQILDLKLNEQGLEATDQAKKTALEVLRRARNRPHFGNAGEIDILLNAAKSSHQKRLSTGKLPSNSAILEAQDFDEDFDRGERSETNVRMLFEGVIGCEGIIEQLEGYQQTAKNMRKLELDPREQVPFNFLFRGPPGTGKTTTARKVGKVYYDMGLLATAEVVECSATDIVGQYVGQTGPKTQKMLEKGLGKVLFIDEAYRLADGPFAKEAMDEIVDGITKPKFSRKLIIILAGYDSDINLLMSINPGLTSRFPETVVFKGLTVDECTALFSQQLQRQKNKLVKRGIDLNIEVLESPREDFAKELTRRFRVLSELPSWANARDIETLARGIFSKVMKSPELFQGMVTVNETAILLEVDSMITERAYRKEVIPDKHIQPSPGPQATFEHSPMTPVATVTHMSAAKTVQNNPPISPSLETTLQPAGDEIPRDPGVTDEVWHRLQQDKLASEARQKEYEDLLERERSLQQLVLRAQKAESNATTALEDAARCGDDEARRLHEEARLQHERERRAREAELDELERKRKAREEERRKERKAQKRLQEMGVCCQGFRWIKQKNGYRCAGGSHFVSDAELAK